MAIALDATSNGVESGASSLTFSHTCASNAVLWVAFFTTATVSTVKYNNVSMTLASTHTLSGSVVYLYILKNPSSGANNIVISLTGNGDVNAISISYTGADTTSQPGAAADGGQSATSPFTASLSTVNSNSWMVMVARNSLGTVTTAGTGSTSRLNSQGMQFYDTNAVVAPGSNSMAVAFTSGTTGVVIAEMKGVGITLTVTDTGTRTEALSFVTGLFVLVTETLASIIDKLLPFRIFSKQTKSTTTWSSQSKS